MADDKQDNFLAVIDRKIAALQTLADSYRAAVSIGALAPGDVDALVQVGAVAAARMADGPMELPQGALLGKSLPAAVKVWLTAARKKQSVREIANGLREGGVESTSPNFENVVTGALHRLKANGEVLRFKDGWALADFYPSSLRSSLSKAAKKPQNRVASADSAPSVTNDAKRDGDDKTSILLGYIRSHPEGRSVSEIVAWSRSVGIELSSDYVRVVTRRLRVRGYIESRNGSFFPKAA